jgi:SH3 domain
MYSRPLGSPTKQHPSHHTVAPLRIVKTPTPQHLPGLHHRPHDTNQGGDPTPPPSPPSPRSPRTMHHEYHGGNISPTTSIPPLQTPPPPPTYLRALHSFRPTATTMTESDCLSFEPDQIIQVHTLHPSGWADGTLLATNERGWFPSNYCEQYTLSNLRPLLGASSLLYATVRAKRVSQYYTVISCVVTSVRGLLVLIPLDVTDGR